MLTYPQLSYEPRNAPNSETSDQSEQNEGDIAEKQQKLRADHPVNAELESELAIIQLVHKRRRWNQRR